MGKHIVGGRCSIYTGDAFYHAKSGAVLLLIFLMRCTASLRWDSVSTLS